MVGERLEILRVMNRITGNVGWKEFLKMVGLTQSQLLDHMGELVETGFVRKVKRGYAITEKGRVALKILDTVPEGMEFHFYNGIGEYAGFSAKSLKDFCVVIKKVSVKALEFHLFREDFEKWIKTVFDDKQLLNEFSRIRGSKLNGESLRSEIVKSTESRYCNYAKLLS